MLGLGNSIDRSGFISAESGPLFFSSVIAADFFAAYSVDGNLSFTANQSAPDGSAGWLKMVFDAEQTSTTGIERSNFNAEMGGITLNESYKVSFDIFLSDGTNSASKAHWPVDPTTTRISFGGQQSQDIAVGESVLYEQTLTVSNTSFVHFYVYWNSPSQHLPNADAQLYIKNFKIEDA
tara:strand:- start:564 stop:1100 length:537 start_codon:yes stop_codon:yes gene_type:complete